MNAGLETSSVAERAAWAAALLLVLVAGFYLARGMPWVHNDDLAFVGAAIDLARTGRLTNHTMDGWLSGFGTDKFYIQFPFSSYLLAGWIHLFGVSTRSFLAYKWGWYAAGGYGLFQVFGHFELPRAVRSLLVIVYLTILIHLGLRPEAEAFGLLFLGLSLVDATARFRRRLGAMLLLGASALTYPLTPAFAVPFAVAILWLQRPAETTVPRWLRETARAWVIPAMLAAGGLAVVFLATIHFEAGLFWAVFDAHRRSRALPGGPLVSYYRLITEYSEAILTLPTVLRVEVSVASVSVKWRSVEQEARVLVIACVAAAAGCIELYSVRAPEWVPLLAFCAACSLATGQRFRAYRWPMVVALAGGYTWSQSVWIVEATLQRFPDAAVFRAAHDAALGSGKAVMVDSSTARHVFDFRLPERTRYLEYIKPFGHESAITMADKTGDTFWVISAPLLVFRVSDLPASYHQYPRIAVGHHAFASLALRPDEPVIFP